MLLGFFIMAFLGYPALVRSAQPSLEPLLSKVGPAMCGYLTGTRMAQWSMRHKCGKPKCEWDSWMDATHDQSDKTPNGWGHRVVLSYGHNGFGNQLWQHTFAFMVAEALQARMLVSPITKELSPNHYYPPNTWPGVKAMKQLLPDEFEYDLLPKHDADRELCAREDFFVSDRPIDLRNRTYTGTFRERFYNLMTDPKPRCLKFVGYFQNYPLCRQDMQQLWGRRIYQNFTNAPGPDDVAIYLRCLPNHYYFNGREFYNSILDRLDNVGKVWMFMAPECPHGKVDRRSKSIVNNVVRMLRDRYNASVWPAPPPGSHEDMGTASLLSDLAALSQSKRILVPLSSWAFWGGFLSNATEVHVNAPPMHMFMPEEKMYVYHSEREKKYFGRYSVKHRAIEYKYHHAVRANAHHAHVPRNDSARATTKNSTLEPEPSKRTQQLDLQEFANGNADH